MDLESKILKENYKIEIEYNQSPKIIFEKSIENIQIEFNELIGDVIQSTIKEFQSYYSYLGYTVEFNNYLSLYSKSKDKTLRNAMKALKEDNQILSPEEYIARRKTTFAVNKKNRLVFSGNLAIASKYLSFPRFKKDTIELGDYYSSQISIGHTFLGTQFQSFNFEVLNNQYLNSFKKLPIVSFRLLFTVNNCTVNKVFSVYLKDSAVHFEFDDDEKILLVDIRTQDEADAFIRLLRNPEFEVIENPIVFSTSPDGKPAPNQIITPNDSIIYDNIEHMEAYSNLKFFFNKIF